jgi:hypothetical protein
LTLHGGDNPTSAALTLCDFIGQVRILKEPRLDDAGLLAVRFIIWQSAIVGGEKDIEGYEATLIHPETDYGYQLARVYANEAHLSVEIVRDQYTTPEEMTSAEILLKSLNLANGFTLETTRITGNP